MADIEHRAPKGKLDPEGRKNVARVPTESSPSGEPATQIPNNIPVRLSRPGWATAAKNTATVSSLPARNNTVGRDWLCY